MNSQLAFDLPFRTAMGAEDFIVTESNRLAVAMMDKWPDWPGRVLILQGAAGAGKTHLAQIWAGISKARMVAGSAAAAMLEPLLRENNIVIDGLDGIAGQAEAEQAVFHLCNHVQQAGSMLLTTALPPPQLGVRLPDLRTRLLSCPVMVVNPPDDALLAALLIKQFNDRQLRVGQDVIVYLLPRLERSTAAIARAVAALDAAALERKGKITIPLAREILFGE